jgi:gluconolactonase
MKRMPLFALPFLFLLSASLPAQENPIPGVGPTGKVVKLHTGFKFLEGPAADRDGNLYFSDIPEEKIHKIDSKGALSVFIEKSNHANGLMVNAKGELVACEMDGQIAAYNLKSKQRRVVAAMYQGKRFNAPNDLVIDRQAGIYFTDPSFRAPMPMPQDKLAVYYVSPEGIVARLIDDLPNPNGVKLSPDENTLYVIPTGPADMMAYPVTAPGKIGKGTVFCKLKLSDKKATGGDGMTIDSKGNLYITSAIGVQVFSPKGEALGTIATPEQPANCTFGGPDFKTLYVTARTSLYAIPMEAAGYVYPAGK